MVHKSSYSIPDLVEAVEEKRITLPTVQRGFVWRPSQIENLWDSLLRGYPIGAFVFAPTDSSTLELLDGQQRLTAICLGLGAQTFRDSTVNSESSSTFGRPAMSMIRAATSSE